MIVGIMQPYLFPYIGYFQLLRAVDLFVCYDDVQYITRGWVNRNRIVASGKPRWLTLPVAKSARGTKINQKTYLDDPAGFERIRNQLSEVYAQAKYADVVMDLIEKCLSYPGRRVSAFNAESLQIISQAVGIKTPILDSSTFAIDPQLTAQDRILAICRASGAHLYVNPIGGTGLYDSGAFAAAGIRLSFLQTCLEPIATTEGLLHPSIIHLLMNHGINGVREMLGTYRLLDTEGVATS